MPHVPAVTRCGENSRGPPPGGVAFRARRDPTGHLSAEGRTSRLMGVGAWHPSGGRALGEIPFFCDAGVDPAGAESNLQELRPQRRRLEPGACHGRQGRVMGGVSPRPSRSRSVGLRREGPAPGCECGGGGEGSVRGWESSPRGFQGSGWAGTRVRGPPSGPARCMSGYGGPRGARVLCARRPRATFCCLRDRGHPQGPTRAGAGDVRGSDSCPNPGAPSCAEASAVAAARAARPAAAEV